MSEIAFPVRSSLAIASAVLLCAGFVAGADCNGNDIDDADDIESGTSSDCNADGVPDECELAPIGFEVTEMSAVLPRTLRVVRTADLDDDGDLDLVAASGPAAATVIYRLENDGGRALIQAQELELAGRTHDLETGDLDGDGRLDVVATTGSTLYLLTNDGTVFRVSAEIALADEEARDVALADIDGDGHTDLVSPVYRAAAVSVRFGDGNGSLGPPLRYTLEADVDAVVPADLDGDARPDLAVLHRTAAAVSTLLNDGSGGFLAPVSHPIDIRANALLAADLDGDLRSELIGPGFILRATGETPGEVTRFEERVTTVTLGDIDGDGDTDLLETSSPSSLRVRVNDGDGRVGIVRTLTVPTSPTVLLAAELDGDGITDVVSADSRSGEIVVLRGGAPPSLGATTSFTPLVGCLDARGCRPHWCAAGDFDGDGDDDVILAITHPGTFALLRNDRGEVTFEEHHVFGGEHPQSVATGDLDGNGTIDAVTVDNLDNNLRVHHNDGDFSFARARLFPVGPAPINVQLGDLDGDGDLDAAAANQSGSSISILFNDGSAAFTPGAQRDYRVAGGPRAIALADLDDDGALDVAVANVQAPVVSVFGNDDGRGTLGERVDHRLRAPSGFVTAGDFNGDGLVDLATANPGTSSTTVLLNQGEGRFADGTEFALGHPPYSVTALDYDGDGPLDLIAVSDVGASIAIARGDGEGEFAAPVQFSIGADPRIVAVSDYDGDGDPDLVTNNREGRGYSVLVNESAESGNAPDFVDSICTRGQFHALSAPALAPGAVRRFVKFLLPARDDATLLPPVFQNTRRFLLHEEFLRRVFPDRFPALTPEEYANLVARRATRQHFAGVVSELGTPGGILWGFNVATDIADSRELLSQEEIGGIYARLVDLFRLEPLVYSPEGRAREIAATWEDPGFPIYLARGPGARQGFQAYTPGVGFGRLRILDEDSFEEANDSGRISFQDVIVLERAPRDIDGVVSGVITAEPQGELSHLAVRTARRGTPNAFLENALEILEPYRDQLVRLEVRDEDYDVEAATPDDAQRWWDESRPRLASLPDVDPDFGEFLTLDEIGDLAAAGAAPEARFGGKATNMARLQRILDGPFTPYRESGFAIPVRYYLEFLRANSIPSPFDAERVVTYEEHLAELLASDDFRTDSEFRFRTLERFRDHAREHGEVPLELVTEIARRVEEVFGASDLQVRFRSSSTAEDSLEFNGAGLYDSTSACAGDDLDGNLAGPSHCRPDGGDEQGIADALREVWASLWNFRAYEERDYYRIPPERVAMAILVTRAFDRERANGVAFTGNPSNAADRRYTVVAQFGEISVVSPPRGIIGEKTLLEVIDGDLLGVVRATRSTLAVPGTFVLSEEQLGELARLLWHVDERFPIDPGAHRRSDVLLDVEFKIEQSGELAIKQVRPFLHPVALGERPTFTLEIPAGTVSCGQFVIGRGPLRELELKGTLEFAPGVLPLPTDRSPFAADLVSALRVGADLELATPLSRGIVRVVEFPGRNERTTYSFSYEQSFLLSGDRRLDLQLSLLDYEARGAEPVESVRILTEEDLIDGLFLRGTLSDGESMSEVSFSGCAHEPLPLWEVEIEAEGSTSIRLEERFRPEPQKDFGPATLVRAEIEAGGERRTVSDYPHLVYAAERHNEAVRYWIVLDPPLRVPEIAEDVHTLEVVAPDEHLAIAGQTGYLDAAFATIETRAITALRRSPLDPDEVRSFLRGDVSANGALEFRDALLLMSHLFRRFETPVCRDAADADDNGSLQVLDVIAIVRQLMGHTALPAPFPDCGRDATPDGLGCGEASSCR